MALGPQHVEAAELPDLVPLGRAFRFVLGDQILVASLAFIGIGVEPAGPDLLVGEQLGVAAQQDVDPAARHVGRHRHRMQPAGLGDHLRFPSMLLGV